MTLTRALTQEGSIVGTLPAGTTGVYFIRPPLFSRDGGSYAYSYARLLSDLYLVDGLK